MNSPFSRPVFILGSPRSGTTLLRSLIHAHPALCCGPETHFLVDLAKIVGPYWKRIERFGFPRRFWTERIAAFLAGCHEAYAHQQGKVRWADKTPAYSLCPDFLLELFPDAQFLHIIRDGHDVVASHFKRWGARSALAAACRVWRSHVETVLDFQRRHPGRVFELRYEKLVADPEDVLRAVLEFLGEPWDPALLAGRLPPAEGAPSAIGRMPVEGRPIHQASVGWGRRLPFYPFRLAFCLFSGSLNQKLGYRPL